MKLLNRKVQELLLSTSTASSSLTLPCGNVFSLSAPPILHYARTGVLHRERQRAFMKGGTEVPRYEERTCCVCALTLRRPCWFRSFFCFRGSTFLTRWDVLLPSSQVASGAPRPLTPASGGKTQSGLASRSYSRRASCRTIGPATHLRSCAATPRPTVRTEPPGVDSCHPSTPLRGYAEAGGSNEDRKEKSLRPFPFERSFGVQTPRRRRIGPPIRRSRVHSRCQRPRFFTIGTADSSLRPDGRSSLRAPASYQRD